jgi:metal-responsive CopG/Arc/MetJ family transcriptional regulator
MSRSAKIACSLDQQLLNRVERMRAKTGESRSALIARALAMVTQEAARNSSVQRYVEAYRERPETLDDEMRARTTARKALMHLRWDEK